MKAKENYQFFKLIIFVIFLILILLILYLRFIPQKSIVQIKDQEYKSNIIKISNAQPINIEEIIKENSSAFSKHAKEEIYEKQEELEYITKYRYNNEIYVGERKISQEGRNGVQKIKMKRNLDSSGNLINEEQISAVVTKSSIDKIIDIGTKIYVPPVTESKEQNISESSGESKSLSFDMDLNKPSGFTEEQFKMMLTDKNDKNKVFEENAEYFYYIEEEYKINGVFVAAIGIHESAWGTSRIAKNKYNLFGYGAYDSNPYNGAYTFSNYSESIDLLARVLVKYYLNAPGTIIYDGEKASGKYYNGSNVSAVNKKYATDKNWANAVYKYMEYLYGKVAKT